MGLQDKDEPPNMTQTHTNKKVKDSKEEHRSILFGSVVLLGKISA